eukprot:6179493-Pleurochrysis_carterae.AAC.3
MQHVYQGLQEHSLSHVLGPEGEALDIQKVMGGERIPHQLILRHYDGRLACVGVSGPHVMATRTDVHQLKAARGALTTSF